MTIPPTGTQDVLTESSAASTRSATLTYQTYGKPRLRFAQVNPRRAETDHADCESETCKSNSPNEHVLFLWHIFSLAINLHMSWLLYLQTFRTGACLFTIPNWVRQYLTKLPFDVKSPTMFSMYYANSVRFAASPGKSTFHTIQGSAKRLRPGCVNAAGKLRQEW